MFSRLLPAAMLIAASHASALAADPINGAAIAERWCSTCHVVAPKQASGSADVPTFAAIAEKFEDERALARFLASPYPRMPNMTLSQPEIADLISYIRTLGPRRDQRQPLDKDEKPGEPTHG